VADFIILVAEEDIHSPNILGRPFLATTGCRIGVKNGKLSFDVEDGHVGFNFLRLLNFLPFLMSVK